jgi:hypothetical protein
LTQVNGAFVCSASMRAGVPPVELLGSFGGRTPDRRWMQGLAAPESHRGRSPESSLGIPEDRNRAGPCSATSSTVVGAFRRLRSTAPRPAAEATGGGERGAVTVPRRLCTGVSGLGSQDEDAVLFGSAPPVGACPCVSDDPAASGCSPRRTAHSRHPQQHGCLRRRPRRSPRTYFFTSGTRPYGP